MKKFNLKKVIGVLIIFCMITEIFSGIHIKASEQKTYIGKGFEVAFNIESQWQGAFNGNSDNNTNNKNKVKNNKYDKDIKEDDYDWEEEEAPELIDIGEAYFEPIDEKDVLIADDGIMYAKNQLNIVGVEGTTYKSIENLGKKYGFEIIGYIELTDDFQVKFNEDKSYEELLEIADELEGYKQIESVYVCTVTISDEDVEESSGNIYYYDIENNLKLYGVLVLIFLIKK